ncbi:MAG TPA: CPBP family intramembrane glutamic endopeptidase, partial [Pyrinomonadaceae bacterium]|nr:CPBP family intramembrane glutamic endopeptidase [Pyrinomonadaceae bacterium]
MRKIFINDFGRLRSGWRVTIFCFACLAILFVVGNVLRVFYVVLFELERAPRRDFIPNLVFHITTLIAALGAGYFCARLLEGLPWRSLGLTFHQRWLRDLLIGFAVGFASLALAVVIAAAAGGLRFSLGGAGMIGPILRSLAGSAVMLFVAALAEEALFRGYPLHTFSRAQLASLGVLLTSITFGLAHVSNPNAVPRVTLINTTLAGIWLAVAW